MASSYEEHVPVSDVGKRESDHENVPSGVSFDVSGIRESGRPSIVHSLSMPTYQSPLRHHQRTPSYYREVKETLNARSEYTNSQDDGKAQHLINQYTIKEEIGRGSFGAVHLAVDQYGREFAVKEFSKARLRKRAQSNILRRPHGFKRPGHLAAGLGFNAPLHRHSASDIHESQTAQSPLHLIKEEIAIMKKLNHPNLVRLIEVLDDPAEDSLYMVLEMCKKGVIMKVGLGEQADPYDEENCRCWFRDLILGIEYLHAQGVVHRDIKPDNLLLTEDDVLKVVDFGVSEMFEKESDMMTAKSAGSPAFMPPELCVAKHGDISGKAADVWSMGVSLYCLRFGRIPFERPGVLELYEAIKNDKIEYKPDNEPQFVDLMHRILEKDPKLRITMAQLREHPWVTKNGADPLLPEEENTANLVEPPTELEVNHAITSNMKNLLTVMKAVGKFKSMLWRRRPDLMSGILGPSVRMVQPPLQLDGQRHGRLQKSYSDDISGRRPNDGAKILELVHHSEEREIPPFHKNESIATSALHPVTSAEKLSEHAQGYQINKASVPPKTIESARKQSSGEKGHAHDPMDEEPLWLGIGPGEDIEIPSETPICAESPTAAEFNIYDTAYQREVERIRMSQGREATVYLTRRVDSKRDYQLDKHMIDAPKQSEVVGQPHAGWKNVLDAAREKEKHVGASMESKTGHGQLLTSIASQVGHNAKAAGDEAKSKGHDLGVKSGSAIGNIVNMATEKTRQHTTEAISERR